MNSAQSRDSWKGLSPHERGNHRLIVIDEEEVGSIPA